MPWIRSAPLGTAALLALVVSSCAKQPTRAEPIPPVVSTVTPLRVSTVMDSVSRHRGVPTFGNSAGTKPVTIRLRPPSADSRRGPPLYVVDGAILGRRRDGTIDRAAAQDALSALDATRITSIEVMKLVPALERFGPIANDGAVLFTLMRPATRREEAKP